jgi:hypothetical protein
MAIVNKNQLAGQRGGEARNEYCNGGDKDCLRRHNAANCGAMWKTKGKWSEQSPKALNFGIKHKRR